MLWSPNYKLLDISSWYLVYLCCYFIEKPLDCSGKKTQGLEPDKCGVLLLIWHYILRIWVLFNNLSLNLFIPTWEQILINQRLNYALIIKYLVHSKCLDIFLLSHERSSILGDFFALAKCLEKFFLCASRRKKKFQENRRRCGMSQALVGVWYMRCSIIWKKEYENISETCFNLYKLKLISKNHDIKFFIAILNC